MIDFSTLKGLTIPEGNVKEIAIGGVTVWKKGAPISTLAVGSSVFMNVNGVRTEFLVVHQGLPDVALYDSSCNGAWVLSKDIHEAQVWDSTDNDYANSDIHSYLNSTFLNKFDSGIRSIIKQVKIPYHSGVGNKGSIVSGSNGLSVKIFLLGGYETGANLSSTIPSSQKKYVPIDGAKLDYFSTNTSRICNNYSGESGIAQWWTRSPSIHADSSAVTIAFSNGNCTLGYSCTNRGGYRPALILPFETLVDDNFNVIG